MQMKMNLSAWIVVFIRLYNLWKVNAKLLFLNINLTLLFVKISLLHNI